MTHTKIPATVTPQLDSLRGLSAIVVLVAHAYQIIIRPTSPLLDFIGLFSQAAVMVFFVLSGLLICKSITRNAATGEGFDLRTYAADRFNRIAPPLAFSLVLVLLLWIVAPLMFPSGSTEFALHPELAARRGFEVVPRYFIGTALFLNGFATGTLSANGPLWSLSFEVWYYVAAGVIAVIEGRKGIAAAIALIAVLGIRNWTFPFLGLVWSAGAGLALAHNSGLRLTRYTRPAGTLALLAAAAFAVGGARIELFNVAFGVAFAALVHEVLLGTLRVPVFAAKSASYSYTLYIVHFPLLLVIYGTLQPRLNGDALASWLVAAAGALGCWAMARLLARWIEHWHPLRMRRSPPVRGVSI